MRRSNSILFFLLVGFFLLPSTIHAFNPGAHIYIADKVFPESKNKIDLYYGSIAPDLSMYVSRAEKWPSAFADTHHAYIDLRRYAWTPTQLAFAKGWLTHNELWGADFYAHGSFPDYDGYVNQKGAALIKSLRDAIDLDPEFAHFAIEVSIDLLLKRNNDPSLGGKLLQAILFRSWEDRNLLTRVLVLKEQRTDWVTLVETESIFRQIAGQYAFAYSLPYPSDVNALLDLGVRLAGEFYGMDVTREQLRLVLDAALDLCAGDYGQIVQSAIEGIKGW